MAGERRVLRNLAFALDGHPISTGANKFEVKIGRERLPWECYEDEGKFCDKGDWLATVAMEGYGIEAEGKLLERLGQDAEDDTSFLLFLESNTSLSPMATPGQAALLMTCRTTDVSMPAAGGKIKQWLSQHTNSDGSRPFLPKVIYTNRGKIPAPFVGASVVTPSPLTLPALGAGMIGIFSVHCTKIGGSAGGNITLLCELLSDTSGFSSPLVRYTFPLFTSENPPSGGKILGPKSQTVILDGDLTPFPGETQWTIRFTAVDSGTGGQAEVMAAGTITNKFG